MNYLEKRMTTWMYAKLAVKNDLNMYIKLQCKKSTQSIFCQLFQMKDTAVLR